MSTLVSPATTMTYNIHIRKIHPLNILAMEAVLKRGLQDLQPSQYTAMLLLVLEWFR
jgi:hypothetical protein